MYLSQTAAVKKLHAATGMSLAFCKAAVSKMPKQKDGLRMKIHENTVRETINSINGFKETAMPGKVRLSSRTKSRLHLLA